VANSPPPVPIEQRSDEQLLDELCAEVRDVAVHDRELPNGPRILASIKQAVVLRAELARRSVDWRARFDALSAETRWQMIPLLEDCLAFPARLPFVRELDGIRRTLRCQLCLQAERPLDARVFLFCDACLRQVIEAVRQRKPSQHILLFRTYNLEFGCIHADSDTVLAADSYVEPLHGVCEQCIHDELERRLSLAGEDWRD
jgi:hypothetical protein